MTDRRYGPVSVDEVELTVIRCRGDLPGRSSADVVLLAGSPDERMVLLVQRAKSPFAGCWALPGGHLEVGETSRAAAIRELSEECGVSLAPPRLRHIGTYEGVDRDPRAQARSEAFVSLLEAEVELAAGSDAEQVRWFKVSECVAEVIELAFDHVRILNEGIALIDGDDHRSQAGLASLAAEADIRNADFAALVRARVGVVCREVLLAEYNQKSNEIVERIKQRDGFINLNIVAAALIVGFAGSSPEHAVAWLALPWSSLCFGWSYLANDEKVSGLANYFEHALGPRLGPQALAWERTPKRATKLRNTHKTIQLVVDLLQFVAPTAAAIVAYALIARHPWTPGMTALVAVEGALAATLGLLFVLHSHLVNKWNVSPEEWRAS